MMQVYRSSRQNKSVTVFFVLGGRMMVRTFKEAVHELLHRSKMPAKEIAELTGKNYVRLCNSANDHQEEHLHGKDIVPLTNLTENYSLIEFLCASVGGVFIRLPKVETGASVELSQHIIEMIQHLGDLSKTLQEALEDQRINRIEGKDLERIVNELVQHCVSFAMEVGRKVEG